MTTKPTLAYKYLIKLLSIRDYSEYKLREKLREKKYPADEIEMAISEIKARNFLREEFYTEARIKGFMNKGYSPNYIRQKLKQEYLSVSDDEINAVFTEHKLTSHDQICHLIQKKIRGKNELDYKEESKILRFLLSKGHDFDESKKIIKSITTCVDRSNNEL